MLTIPSYQPRRLKPRPYIDSFISACSLFVAENRDFVTTRARLHNPPPRDRAHLGIWPDERRWRLPRAAGLRKPRERFWPSWWHLKARNAALCDLPVTGPVHASLGGVSGCD
jgi:hypothetical protein